MNTQVAYAVSGLVVGVLLTVFVSATAVNTNQTGMMRMMGMDTNRIRMNMAGDEMMHGGTMGMDEMVAELEGKTGEAFDAAFLTLMIEHHQGAIEMAKLIPTRAQHNEIKQLGEAIITAQTKEIGDMRQWQQDWGY